MLNNQLATKLTKQAFVIFVLTSFFYLYEFVIQVSPGVMAHDLMRDFSLNATGLGAMSGCFYYSYTVMQFPAGLLLDRYSTRLILTMVSAVCASGVLLFAMAPNLYMASLARFIIGGAAAFAFIGVLHVAIRWVPLYYFALFVGMAETMGSLGAMTGNAPLAIMLKHFTWRLTIVIFALFGFILAFLIYCIVRDSPVVHKKSKKRPRKYNLSASFKIIFGNKQTWFISIYSFTIWAPVLAFSALWGVSFLIVSCHINHVAAAKAVSFSWFGVALASPVIGWISDKIKRRCLLLIISAFIGTIAMAIVVFVPNIQIIILYCLMLLIGFGSAGQTISFALIKDNNSPFTNSAANGFNNMVVVAGGILFQPLIGKFLDLNWQGVMAHGVRIYSLHSYRMAFLVLPICYFIAFIASLFFIQETHCKAVWKTRITKGI
jgi:MFS family permease